MAVMPVCFYCPFCGLLLTASRKQVGDVVDCPRCQGGVGVPVETRASPPPLPAVVPAGVVLSRGGVAVLILVVALLVALTFVAGLLFGRFG